MLAFTTGHVPNPEKTGKMIKMIESGSLTDQIAKNNYEDFCKSNRDPEDFFKAYMQIHDAFDLNKICQEVIDRNTQIVADFKGGKEKAFGGLVGQVMGATKGSANPKSVNEILRKLLA